MATNNKSPGTFANVHKAFVPFGPGVSLHILRNVLATAGLRMFCGPATAVIEGVTGKSNEKTARMQQFLKEQYFNIDASGKTGGLKATVARDMFMRSMYVAVAYTMFSTIERSLVKLWPK